MSGLVRRLIIFATAEGLVLHAHGSAEHQRSVALEYGSARLQDCEPNTPQHGVPGSRLEAFGLIGIVDIASSSYLIAITKRKHVAKIFDKPVYLIEDVAVLPLSSQTDAEQAIKSAIGSVNLDSNESNGSDSEPDDETPRQDSSAALSTTPGDEVRPHQEKNASSTSIAEIVATRNVSFGKFASQWFSRQRPTSVEPTADTEHEAATPKPAEKGDTIVEDVDNAVRAKEAASTSANTSQTSNANYVATRNLLPRILRTIKMVFTSQSYFFSYDFDLTRRIQDIDTAEQKLNLQQMNSVVCFLLCWRYHC